MERLEKVIDEELKSVEQLVEKEVKAGKTGEKT